MKNVLVRTSSMRAVNRSARRAGSMQHVQNPISQDMASRKNDDSDGTYSTARPQATVQHPRSQDMVEIEMTSITAISNSKSNQKNKKKNRRKTVMDKIKFKKNKSKQPRMKEKSTSKEFIEGKMI
jgi:hypothetical protein